MGYAVAEACRELGAEVTLVSGPVSLAEPAGMALVKVESALEMFAACRKAFKSAHAFVSCAAVSDYRPARTAAQKLKKTGRPQSLRLEPNPDILLTLSKSKGGRVLVGFAAETEKLLEHGADKLKRKKLDLLVANRVDQGRGFGSDDNEAWLLRPIGAPEALPLQSKSALARRLADELAGLLAKKA
jgi:phosphopantothenoylcysteine decarboxylase/phosphopantothenate--cysteine ligase